MVIQDNKRWIGVLGVVAVALILIHFLLDLSIFNSYDKYIPLIKEFTLTLFVICLILLIGQIVAKAISSQSHLQGERYNLLRITRFLSIVLSLIVGAAFLFQNLLAAAVSFGLISLVLGFALQAPISSFIAWIYLIFRRSYLVGDRIQIKTFRGDVLEISYLETIIMECSGDYLGNDRSSGRVIRFPNSLILREEVINYSGFQAPFIWNEIPIQVAYTSDLQFVEECLLEASAADFKKNYPHIDMVKNAQWEPAVYFRVNTYAWMEAVVSYPVEPKDTTGRRNRILRTALPALNAAPGKVQFPEGALR